MGSGKGPKIDLSFILKVIALILTVAALGLNVSRYGKHGGHVGRMIATSNCFKYASGGYIIILAIFLGWMIFKDDVEKLFAGILLAFGFIYNLGAGAAVISYYTDYKNATKTNPMIGGVLVMFAGIIMLVDALHTFEVF